MKWKAKDKENWNKFFPVFPVKTIEGDVAWLETVYRRYRYIGCCTEMQGSDFVEEYSIKGDN